MNKNMWSQIRFSEMFKYNPRSAFEYRQNCLGDAIPEEYLTDEEINANIPNKETELSREEMKDILTKAKVDFAKNMSNIKMLELIKTNGLI